MLVFVRKNLFLVPTLLLPIVLTGCSRTASPGIAETKALAAEQRQEIDLARQQMDLIPPPSKTRYMAVKSLAVWENP
jgi:hypothetical protein